MQITCPSCAAAYAVPEEKLAGRAVKCARCGTQWTPVPEPIIAVPPLVEMPPAEVTPANVSPVNVRPVNVPAEPVADTGTEKYPPLFGTDWPPSGLAQTDLAHSQALFSDQPTTYRTEAPQSGQKGLIVAWVASIAILGALVIACFVNRVEIMHAWPPSARAYAIFGLR